MDKLKLRIQEALSIYRDSPGVTVTYIDLARMCNYFLEIIENKEKIGFTREAEVKNDDNDVRS